jgi:hypothetical protein
MRHGDSMEMTTIGVGEQSPFSPLGQGQSALAITIASDVLTIVIQLPEVTREDVEAAKAKPLALALLQTAGVPVGVLTLALGVSAEAAWPLTGPIVAAEEVLRVWAALPLESNVVLVVLVDSNTNLVRALRTIGAPMDFLTQVQSGIQSCRQFDLSSFVQEARWLSSEKIWATGLRWIRDDEIDEFVRV